MTLDELRREMNAVLAIQEVVNAGFCRALRKMEQPEAAAFTEHLESLQYRICRLRVEVRPSFINAWNNLALAYELTGDVAAAKRALRRSLEIAPDQPDASASLRRLERS